MPTQALAHSSLRKPDIATCQHQVPHDITCALSQRWCRLQPRRNHVSTTSQPRRNHVANVKILVHVQDSCACTTILCMHNTLVHALEGPGTKAGTRNKTAAGPAWGRLLFCWIPALVPGPSRACTRVLSVRKSVVHAQESCACTRILTFATWLRHRFSEENTEYK